MEPTTSNASAKIIGALVIGLLVGFAAGVFWQDRRSSALPSEEDTASETATSTKTSATADGKEQTASAVTGMIQAAGTDTAPAKSLMVEDQAAGDRVEIANFDASETLWVAVREEIDGKLGNILGAQKVFTGEDQKVTVLLLRSTVAGGTYRVVFYRDVGTPAFNHHEDVLIEGVEGKFSAK